MPEHLDPTMIGIAFLIWPTAKSLIAIAAAATGMWSRDERRRRTAERILRSFGNYDDSGNDHRRGRRTGRNVSVSLASSSENRRPEPGRRRSLRYGEKIPRARRRNRARPARRRS